MISNWNHIEVWASAASGGVVVGADPFFDAVLGSHLAAYAFVCLGLVSPPPPTVTTLGPYTFRGEFHHFFLQILCKIQWLRCKQNHSMWLDVRRFFVESLI